MPVRFGAIARLRRGPVTAAEAARRPVSEAQFGAKALSIETPTEHPAETLPRTGACGAADDVAPETADA